MSVTTSDLIQILQLIVLAFTAVVFISQFALRAFISDSMMSKIEMVEGEEGIDKFRNGATGALVSISFFMVSGTLLSTYLLLSAVPEQIDHYIGWFETYQWYFGGGLLLLILSFALFIKGESENPTKGYFGAAVSTFLAGGVSLFLILLYVGLLIGVRSIEWVFFVSMICLVIALFAFLFGSFTMGSVFIDIVDEVWEQKKGIESDETSD